jgi:hypothetical protein
MTNMKALPMLDHVMLWVARGFTAILLAIFSYVCLSEGCIIFSSLRSLHWHWHEGLASSLTALVTPLLIVALANVSLWFPRKMVARIYLFLLGFTFLLGMAYLLLMKDGLIWKIIISLSILDFAAMIWISIRPPQNSKTSNPDSLPDHPLPNPVNLVNPV